MNLNPVEELKKAIQECTSYKFSANGNLIQITRGTEFSLKWERFIAGAFTLLVGLLPAYVFVKYLFVNKKFDIIAFMLLDIVIIFVALSICVIGGGMAIMFSRTITIDRNKEIMEILEPPKKYTILFKEIRGLKVVCSRSVPGTVSTPVYHVVCEFENDHSEPKKLFDMRKTWSSRSEREFAEKVCSALKPILKCYT